MQIMLFFHSKIINLKKRLFSINKYQKFLNYFYEKFDNKYFGVEVCIAIARKAGIVAPSIEENQLQEVLEKINASYKFLEDK